MILRVARFARCVVCGVDKLAHRVTSQPRNCATITDKSDSSILGYGIVSLRWGTPLLITLHIFQCPYRSGMRERSVLAGIEVPLELVEGQTVLLDCATTAGRGRGCAWEPPMISP